MNFYSENGVDQFLSEKLPLFGYAVDVGANNGIAGSNSKHFEDRGWLVMCVEPNPRLEEEGRKARKLWQSAACGNQSFDQVEFTCVGDYPYSAYSGFKVAEGEKWMPPTNPERQRLLSLKTKYSVPMTTLNQILQGSGFPRLDFLTVDVEGNELEVMQGIDLERWRPAWICSESWNQTPPDAEYLKTRGYKLVHRLQVDNLYQRL